MKDVETDIAILGAGLTGLAIAHSLDKRGYNITLLEKEDVIGGLAKTIEFQGFRFDFGGHRLYFRNKESFQYIKGILNGNGLVYHKRKSSIFLKGRFLRYPPHILDFFSYNFSNIVKFALDSLYISKRRKSLALKDWLVSRFGPTLHNEYFRDYTQKVWGLSTESMSADWAERRIGSLTKWHLIKDLFKKSYDVKENLSIFYYPEGGIGRICEGLSKRLNHNSQIILGAEVEKINYKNKRLSSIIYRNRKNGEERLLRFRHLISTIPLISLYKFLFSLDKIQEEDLNNRVRYRNLILVFFILNQDRVFNEHWIYFPQLDISFARISEPKNWSSQMACADKTSLCVELFCGYKDKMWNEQDEEITEMVIDSLEKLNIISKKKIDSHFILRVPFAYPLLYLGYQTALAPIFKCLYEFKNLNLAGRTGTHSYYDMEECLDNAKKLVSMII